MMLHLHRFAGHHAGSLVQSHEVGVSAVLSQRNGHPVRCAKGFV